jgi:hypothetical protein
MTTPLIKYVNAKWRSSNNRLPPKIQELILFLLFFQLHFTGFNVDEKWSRFFLFPFIVAAAQC